jgi:hypothetical protein
MGCKSDLRDGKGCRRSSQACVSSRADDVPAFGDEQGGRRLCRPAPYLRFRMDTLLAGVPWLNASAWSSADRIFGNARPLGGAPWTCRRSASPLTFDRQLRVGSGISTPNDSYPETCALVRCRRRRCGCGHLGQRHSFRLVDRDRGSSGYLWDDRRLGGVHDRHHPWGEPVWRHFPRRTCLDQGDWPGTCEEGLHWRPTLQSDGTSRAETRYNLQSPRRFVSDDAAVGALFQSFTVLVHADWPGRALSRT